MKVAKAGNDMIAPLFSSALDKWVGLVEFAETLNKLREITCVLDFNSDTHGR